LGLEGPDAPARVPYTPGEFAALAAGHKDAAVIEKAMGGGAWSSGGVGGGDHSKSKRESEEEAPGLPPGGAKGGQGGKGGYSGGAPRSDAAASGWLWCSGEGVRGAE
jgi:hypothetical protein